MSNSKYVSRQFVQDFELVAAHYNLKELGEYETAKDLARNDLENAVICYSELAKDIRKTY